jgi:hypothetical protein
LIFHFKFDIGGRFPTIVFWMQFVMLAVASATQIEVGTGHACEAFGGKIALSTSIAENAWHLPSTVSWVHLVAPTIALRAQVIVRTIHAFVPVAWAERALSTSITINAWKLPIVMSWVLFVALVVATATQIEVGTIHALMSFFRRKI